ncbi:SDR family NAD(P)-dependent oxidoreductase [Rhodobacterales bacterium HKCCE2091]|nr:SDR family NAD(P)-dependent oxidoreductase [Rhodobacterales bacterium HKCCE2091]
MSGFAGQTWWIVGASDGLGAEIARALSREGATLILSARSADKLNALADELDDAHALPVDVTDTESVEAGVEIAGDADGVVWTVGRYEPMSAGSWDAEEGTAIVDVNFMGAMRLLGRVVPRMVRRGRGHVVLVGSLSGYRGISGTVAYGASKAAIMSLAETLRADTDGSGVKVQLANPGFIRTRLTEKNDFRMPQIMEPEEAAGHVMALMRTDRFKADFPKPFAWLFTWGRLLLPLSLFHRITTR